MRVGVVVVLDDPAASDGVVVGRIRRCASWIREAAMAASSTSNLLMSPPVADLDPTQRTQQGALGYGPGRVSQKRFNPAYDCQNGMARS